MSRLVKHTVHGNIAMLKHCMKWMKDVPKDDSGRGPLEYCALRLADLDWRIKKYALDPGWHKSAMNRNR